VKERIRQSLEKAGARRLVAGVCQMRNRCGGEAGKAENLGRMQAAIAVAAGEGVQLLAFPEMCLPGYFTEAAGTPEEAVAANRALADVVGESAYLAALQEAAAAAEMVLVFGFGERQGEDLYNAAGVVDADGRWLGTRRKNPLSAGPYEQDSFRELPPSERGAVFATRYGTIGVSICFDGEFPESIRRMRLEGAEVLVWCNCATGDPVLGHSHRLVQSGAYATTNCLWVVCCNACGENTYGTSCVWSPWGEPLVQLSVAEEEMGVAEMNLAYAPDWRMWRDRVWLGSLTPCPPSPSRERGE
jgi:N-carbamoylputrescine amidase